jgi:prephenate dehydratase/chorismate mutase/prephenate dehydratase
MNLDAIRKRIDLIDLEILQLLNNRMELAVRTRRFKGYVTDAKREQEIFDKVKRLSHNLLKPAFSERLYQQIIVQSKEIQEQQYDLIGFQGEHGAYSEVASLAFDKNLIPIPCREFHEVFQDVAAGRLDLGMVPVENSLEGAVTQVNDLLIETELRIIGEINIPVHHSLLSLPETEYRDLKVVYSHPQALAQCRGFIARHGLEPRPFYDTAGAAKMLAKDRYEAAGVIANRLCADLYHLDIIQENIEDHPSNTTRFVVLSKDGVVENGDKCSVLFSLKHEAGALFAVLKIFSDGAINLTRIESRPARNKPGNYVFFSDFEGSEKDERVIHALKALKEKTIGFKFLGCYRSYKEGKA